MAYRKHVAKTVPAPAPAPAVFTVSNWVMLDRFLILGCEGGSFYASERKMTKSNANAVLGCLREDPKRTIDRIVDVSERGLAHRNTAAVFALSLCLGTDMPLETRSLALAAVNRVCRIGTDLFNLVADARAQRGWGPIMTQVVRNWYNQFSVDDLAFQMVKYAQREGWSHSGLLAMSHAKPTAAQSDLYRWARFGVKSDRLPAIVQGTINIQQAVRDGANGKAVASIIEEYRLPREAVPSDALGHKEVWAALFEHMPIKALIRNLPTLTRHGLLDRGSDNLRSVQAKLSSVELLRKRRVHPMQILLALRTYASGKSERGSNTWTPVPQLIDILDDAFYLSFQGLTPSDHSVLVGVDVSGSMGWSNTASGMTCRDAAAAMAMVMIHQYPNCDVRAFAHTLQAFPISKKQRLDDVIKSMERMSFGSTDCSLPMRYATKSKLSVDAFIVITDNETNFGGNPHQALLSYRDTQPTPDAKLAVMAMVANEISIADPNDSGMLDVVGFSADVPAVLSQFIG